MTDSRPKGAVPPARRKYGSSECRIYVGPSSLSARIRSRTRSYSASSASSSASSASHTVRRGTSGTSRSSARRSAVRLIGPGERGLGRVSVGQEHVVPQVVQKLSQQNRGRRLAGARLRVRVRDGQSHAQGGAACRTDVPTSPQSSLVSYRLWPHPAGEGRRTRRVPRWSPSPSTPYLGRRPRSIRRSP